MTSFEAIRARDRVATAMLLLLSVVGGRCEEPITNLLTNRLFITLIFSREGELEKERERKRGGREAETEKAVSVVAGLDCVTHSHGYTWIRDTQTLRTVHI